MVGRRCEICNLKNEPITWLKRRMYKYINNIILVWNIIIYSYIRILYITYLYIVIFLFLWAALASFIWTILYWIHINVSTVAVERFAAWFVFAHVHVNRASSLMHLHNGHSGYMIITHRLTPIVLVYSQKYCTCLPLLLYTVYMP